MIFHTDLNIKQQKHLEINNNMILLSVIIIMIGLNKFCDVYYRIIEENKYQKNNSKNIMRLIERHEEIC